MLSGRPGLRFGARIPLLFAALLLANLLAWAWAGTAFAGRPALLGLALLAWMFGLRHAVDADHIAAIDNVVRKLMYQGERPLLTGTYFSLGHSTVVVLAAGAVAAYATHLPASLLAVSDAAGLAGAMVSASVLLGLGLLNVVALSGAWRRLRQPPAGAGLSHDGSPSAGGMLSRLLQPLFRAIGRPWHMFPLGFLFGLGFDTATEIGLLGIAAAQSAQGVSPLQTMVFPALFTAGMVLVDSGDSVLMVGAYGWAQHHPRRKLWYDLIITGLSVAVALVIGGIEAGGLLAGHFGLQGRLWSAVANAGAHGTQLGLGVVAAFLLVWGSSVAIDRRRVRSAAALRAGVRQPGSR